MDYSQLTILIVMAIASISFAQTGFNHPYMHPHEAIYKLEQMKAAQSQLTGADVEVRKKVFQTLNPKDVLQQITRRRGAIEISDLCFNQTLYLVGSMFLNETNNGWALDMIDAWGKPQAGIRKLSLAWLGSFDECVGAQSNLTTSSNSTFIKPYSFEGKYCGLGTPAGVNHINPAVSTGINVGSCFPSGCSEKDIHNAVAALLQPLGINSTVNVGCQEKHMAYSNAAIAAIILYSVVGAMCVLGTLYDAIFIMTAPHKAAADDDVPALNTEAGDNTDTAILINSQEAKVERKPGALGDFLMCFSLYTNGYKLLSTKQAPGSLNCLNGIRFISMTWVILGHTLVFTVGSVDNALTIFTWFKRFTFQVVLNALMSVDSFFLLSAMLITYLLLKDLERKNTTPTKFLITVPIMYLHRYIRLTPAYAFMILFYTCLMLYMYEGPLKPTHTTIGDEFCTTQWWTSLLYINNVYQPLKQCAAWGWYLSNDFQFYLLAPFVIYLIYRVPKAGLLLAVVMVITSAGAATGVSIRDRMGINIIFGRDANAKQDPQELANFTQYYYFAPWSRYQSFGVGIIYGYILWKCKGRLPIPRVANLVLWVVSAALLLSVLYGPYNIDSGKHVASVAEASIYNGWARIAWCMGLGYIILACCLGRGGWVNEFLSWPGFVPLSRMTYCAYLVHPVIMTIVSSSHKNKVQWDDITYIYMFAGYVTLAYAVAFLFSLMFEAPFMHIDKKYITGRLSKSKK